MKSLEARIADRKKRKEEAEKVAKENGTAQPKDAADNDGEGDGDDYASYTVAELKAELDTRKIEYAASSLKADLIALLEEADANE